MTEYEHFEDLETEDRGLTPAIALVASCAFWAVLLIVAIGVVAFAVAVLGTPQ